MTIQARITLPNFDKQFTQNVTKELTKYVKSIMKSATLNIKTELQSKLIQDIGNSDAWIQVKDGILRGELGIPPGTNVDAILDTWAQGIEVEYVQGARGFGRIDIRMIRQDYSDVLSLPESSFNYFSAQTFESKTIDWLRWLLLEGPNTIVVGYEFEPKNLGRSRTGQGIMVKTGGGWSVPSQYAGTATDNFATRALEDIESTITDVVQAEIRRRF